MTAEWDQRAITPWPIAENFGVADRRYSPGSNLPAFLG